MAETKKNPKTRITKKYILYNIESIQFLQLLIYFI